MADVLYANDNFTCILESSHVQNIIVTLQERQG